MRAKRAISFHPTRRESASTPRIDRKAPFVPLVWGNIWGNVWRIRSNFVSITFSRSIRSCKCNLPVRRWHYALTTCLTIRRIFSPRGDTCGFPRWTPLPFIHPREMGQHAASQLFGLLDVPQPVVVCQQADRVLLPRIRRKASEQLDQEPVADFPFCGGLAREASSRSREGRPTDSLRQGRRVFRAMYICRV